MRFFVDNCISEHLVGALRELDPNLRKGGQWDIAHLREKFRAETSDEVWLSELGSEGNWTVVSGDIRITRGAERKVWQESGLTAFFFGGEYANRKQWKQVMHFLHWWPEIKREAREHREACPGSGYVIPMRNKGWKVIAPSPSDQSRT